MIKRILGAIILLPIIILVAFWGVNFLIGVLNGTVSLPMFLTDHKFIIGLVAAYLIYKYLNPFKKRS